MTEAQLAGWELAGARQAAAVQGDSGAVVVLGKDVEATARAALGLARALARTHQVALADLLGDSTTLAGLVDDPSAPGIADSFVHGVSLNRVARPVRGEGRLFILPSGGFEASAPDVLASTRWDRLARGFKQVHAQLIVVAHAGEPEAEGLARRLGGAIAVGTDVVLGPDVHTIATLLPVMPSVPPSARVLPSTWEAGPLTAVEGRTAEFAGVSLAAGREAAGSAEGFETGVSRRRALFEAPPRSRLLLALGVLALVGGAGIAMARERWRGASSVEPSEMRAAATPVDIVLIDTVGLEISNPSDSARAAAFSVEVLATNTLEGALAVLRDSLPAGTAAPALLGPSRSRWYRVVAGAYATRREADSLLADLVRRKRATEGAARVILAPLAFRLERGLSSDTTPLALARWRRNGIPAYVLVQDDGKMTIFAGAFERLDQAALLVPALRAVSVEPDLAYRTGRTF